MNFSVGSVWKNNFKGVSIGIIPGRFDSKQVMLAAIAIMYFTAKDRKIQIVRTIDRKQLEKCNLFLTDAFDCQMNNISIYNSVSDIWEDYGEIISRDVDCSVDSIMVLNYAQRKICALEKFDFLSEYNNFCLTKDENENLERAINQAIVMIREIVTSAAAQSKMHFSILKYIEEAKCDILYIPFSINAKETVSKVAPHIRWIITKEFDDLYMLESTDDAIDIRRIIKDYKNVIYVGRDFCKVSTYEGVLLLLASMKEKIKITA